MRSAHKQLNASAELMPDSSTSPANASPCTNVWALAGLNGYLANLATCPDGTPATDDFVIGARDRLN